MNSAAIGLTKPAAGVMATKPATAPEMAPSALGLPLRSHKRAGREIASSQRTSRIKAEPTHPEEASSDEAEHDAMRRHRFAGIAETASQINCTDQGRDSRSDVHDRAAGEIKRGESPAQSGIQQTSLAPNHVCHGI